MYRATTVNYITVKKQHPQSTHWNHKRTVQTKMQGQTATTNTLQNCNNTKHDTNSKMQDQ